MRSVRLTALLLLCACQPQARRMLVLDLALSEPALLNGTVQPWRDEGYNVEYRRFYPHLARADLDRYRVLLFLLGREPEAPSDALTAAARPLRSAVGGEGPGMGGEPRGSPVGGVYEPFPLDRNNVLTVRDHAALLAVTSGHAFVRAPRPPRTPSPRGDAGVVAAARVGEGLVLVISRHALGALGPQFRPTTAPLQQPDALERTRGLLTAPARWTRRPAEWAHE